MLFNCGVGEVEKLEKWRSPLWCGLGSPLDYKEIKSVNPKGNQSWVFFGRTDEDETPILWPPDVKS